MKVFIDFIIKGDFMYSIGEFRVINKAQNYLITMHGQIRLRERHITIDDLIAAIDTGIIIEQYEQDYPLPSCLIMGKIDNRVIHMVVSKEDDTIYLITAYEPDKDKWSDDFKQRKRGIPNEMY